MRGLKDLRVIVTGGASGIGRATVQRLAEEGCVVGILDWNIEGARETAAMSSGSVTAYHVDVTSYEQVRQAGESFEAQFGPVSGLVNLAGYDSPMWFLESDRAHWDKHLGINLYGPLITQHVFVKGMVERRKGRVVNCASGAALHGAATEAVYTAAKGGLVAFSKALAKEVARHGVVVNVVCPGPTDTPMFRGFQAQTPDKSRAPEALLKAIPVGRLGRPDDYGGMIAFLLSDDTGFITGQTISVSGGRNMV